MNRSNSKLSCLLAVLALVTPFVAQSEESPVQGLKQRMDAPAEVLVLATSHLGSLEGMTPGHVEGLVGALSRFAPAAVVVEALPAHAIEAMQQQADLHPEALDSFVGKSFLALATEQQRALGIDPAGARKALAAECVTALPATPGASQRCIRLAAAAWDKPWVDYLGWYHARQWPANKLDGALGTRVAALARSTNENELIGARLASQFQLARVHGMDDHPGIDLYGPVFDALLPVIGQSKAYAAFQTDARVVKEAGERTRNAIGSNDLLPLYLWLNSAEYSALTLDEEWRLFVDRDLPRKPGQARIALWDVRNLAMVSNILRVVSQHPGGRVLVIVGASHKPFFDDYLNRSIGVRVRQLDEFVSDGARVPDSRGY